MAEPSSKAEQSSSSSSSGEVSVKFEKETDGGGGGNGRELEVEARGTSTVAAGDGAKLGNGETTSPGDNGKNVTRVNTMPIEIRDAEKLESPKDKVNLWRSKTETHGRHTKILADEAAQIYDDKMPVQEKLNLLKRIATVKHDGTVEFEVPGDVEPQDLGVEAETAFCEAIESVDTEEIRYIPPIQIVMLIVGTRGDVQPFVAIGKRLQVFRKGLCIFSGKGNWEVSSWFA